jgi:integrase
MKPATILRIHSIISSALDLAVRYDWADRNVAKNASPPHPRKREPDPPSPDQAARLLNLVWAEDDEFGLYLWTAFTTGARRGEVSALRENRFDFKSQQVRLARNYLVKQGQHIEKAPKDGEGRVLSLDLLTCELFQERFQRRRAEARAISVDVPQDAFAFSPDPAGREPWNPDTMTHRYRRYARRVGITGPAGNSWSSAASPRRRTSGKRRRWRRTWPRTRTPARWSWPGSARPSAARTRTRSRIST